MSSRVTFSGGRFHRYSLDGHWVPSVTTVVRKVGDKGGLIGGAVKATAAWAAIHADELPQLGEQQWRKVAAGAHQVAWDESRDRGTLLHSLAERLVYGQPLPTEDESGLPWPDDVFHSAQQLAKFMDAWHVDPLAHEAIVWHEADRWAGRFDLLASLSDGDRWLLDYKTGQSGIWPDTSLQLAAYAHATHIVHNGEDRPMPHIDRAAAVWVRPTEWQLVPVAIGDAVYEVFRHAIPVAAWAALPRDRSVGAPLPVPPKVA